MSDTTFWADSWKAFGSTIPGKLPPLLPNPPVLENIAKNHRMMNAESTIYAKENLLPEGILNEEGLYDEPQ